MDKKPNVLFILIDDMGWTDLGCFGSSFYETPNIDKLAAKGMLFTNAYAACPVCSPTRASLLSGKYPATLGLTDYIDHSNNKHPSRGRLVDVSYVKELNPGEWNLARALKAGGYHTWHVGKWHVGGHASYPQHQGFDVNIGGGCNGHPNNGYFSPWKLDNLDDAAVAEGTYLTDHITDEAVRLIKSKDEKPFFLNMWYYTVHTPVQAKEEHIERFRLKAKDLGLDPEDAIVPGELFPKSKPGKPRRIMRRIVQSNPTYAAMIWSLDENVGKLVRALEEIGERDNTIIVFTSDNGGLSTSEGAPTCNAPLSEGKGWMYEGGTREPLIVNWPGHVEAGTRCDAPVTSPDFYPTVLEMAGLDLIPEQHCDGESFLGLLNGDATRDRAPLFWHYPHYGNQGGTPGSSIREGDYKLIEFFEDGRLELYNLKEDIGEDANLAEAMPELTSSMHEKLVAWRKSIYAKIPRPNPDYRPVDA